VSPKPAWPFQVASAALILAAGIVGGSKLPRPAADVLVAPVIDTTPIHEEVVPPHDKIADKPVEPLQPVVDPNITPVIPLLPSAAITVTDAHGLPITDEARLGQMLIISSDKAVRGPGDGSLVWIVEPQLETHVWNGSNELVVVTPKTDSTISIMQIVAMGDKLSYQKVRIKCGTGALPPPIPPGPPIDDKPKPDPVVKQRKVFLALVADTAHLPADSIVVRNAIGIWNGFRSDGSDWRFYDVTTSEAKGKKAVADAAKAGVLPPQPALVVYDLDTGALIDTIKQPTTIADLQSAVNKYKGITP
jgi:hypothetical protein